MYQCENPTVLEISPILLNNPVDQMKNHHRNLNIFLIEHIENTCDTKCVGCIQSWASREIYRLNAFTREVEKLNDPSIHFKKQKYNRKLEGHREGK